MSAALERRADWLRRELGVPAIGLAVTDLDGAAEVAVRGVRRRGSADAARVDDRWHIGSCGKSVTAVLYARLVERGDARWEAPLPGLFPDLAVDRGWADVTIEQVLLHRAGLPANLDGATFAAAYTDPRPDDAQRTAAVAAALGRAPDRVGAFRYSNLGYVVAGAAVERLTGMHIEQALREHVLEPLRITSAGWGAPSGLSGHRGRLVLGPLALGRGPAVAPDEERADNPPVLTPAGRLHLTLDDWARFLRVLLDGDHPLLTRATVDRLLALPPGKGPRQAMGWAAGEALPGVSYGQQGSNMHWVATVLLDADRRRAAVVATNDGRTMLLRSTPRVVARLLTEV